MTKQGQIPVTLLRTGLLAGITTASAASFSVSYGAPYATGSVFFQGTQMTAQEAALVDAKIDAKTSELRGDLRVNTEGLKALKERFDDLNGRMAKVPSDIATLTERVSHLPTKGLMVSGFLGTIGAFVAIIGFAEKVQHLLGQ